jgi:phasin
MSLISCYGVPGFVIGKTVCCGALQKGLPPMLRRVGKKIAPTVRNRTEAFDWAVIVAFKARGEAVTRGFIPSLLQVASNSSRCPWARIPRMQPGDNSIIIDLQVRLKGRIPVSDANANVEENACSSRNEGRANLGAVVPFFVIPSLFRGFGELGVGRANESCQKVQAASGEIAEVLREAYSANAKGAADYGARLIEISRENTSSALEYMTDLIGARSLSAALNVSAAHSRKNLELASARNRELLELVQKVATEAAEPIKKSFVKVLESSF